MINRINVPREFRGRGIASTLLKRILADADREGATVGLGISPSDGLSYKELKAWYERYGFRPMAEKPLFVRQPGGGS